MRDEWKNKMDGEGAFYRGLEKACKVVNLNSNNDNENVVFFSVSKNLWSSGHNKFKKKSKMSSIPTSSLHWLEGVKYRTFKEVAEGFPKPKTSIFIEKVMILVTIHAKQTALCFRTIFMKNLSMKKGSVLYPQIVHPH